MKKYLLLFLVILNASLFGITEVWEAVVPDNYTDAIAGENGSCVVIDQANYNLLWYNSSGILIKSFSLSDLVNGYQLTDIYGIYPFRVSNSVCALKISSTYSNIIIAEFENHREDYGNNGNFITARSYDYFAAIDNSNNKLSVYKMGLDDNKTSLSTIPSNAVVIPSNSSGPVQIVLESSEDMVNWNSANPGTYGASTNERFFRVRAVEDTE